mgnify:CR=1 FL=1
MRLWDLHPGYLENEALHREHDELHALLAAIASGSENDASSHELINWKGSLPSLALRHALVAEEMLLRGMSHSSPIPYSPSDTPWPASPLASPGEQLALLRGTPSGSSSRRIPLPRSAQQIWRQHKYSVMARDVNAYKEFGPRVARSGPRDPFDALTGELTSLLWSQPSEGGIRNALLHMWGYLSEHEPRLRTRVPEMPLRALAHMIQRGALRHTQPYLLEQTALSELLVWIPAEGATP